MIVAELIEWLKQFPSDAEVTMLVEESNEWSSWRETRSFNCSEEIVHHYDEHDNHLFLGEGE